MSDDKYRDKWEQSVDRSLETFSSQQMSMRGELGQVHAEMRAMRSDTHRANDLLESIHRRLDGLHDEVRHTALPDAVRAEVVEDWAEVRLYSLRFGSILKHGFFGALKLAAVISGLLLVWAISQGFRP